MILTVDLGTSVTKAVLWDAGGVVAQAGVGVETLRPRPRWLEQDPSAWWSSLTEACTELRARAGERFGEVDVVGCTGTRQSVVLADASGAALGPAIIWSDRRAGLESERLAAALGGEQVFARTGVPLEAGAVTAKVAWLADNDPDRLAASAWVLAPRDFMAWRLIGEVVTDPTMASRSGLYDLDGRVVDELAGAAGSRLAPVVPSDAVSGRLQPDVAAALGLVAGTPVVIGAGDRACEVLGSGASESSPMVSWGTTANVSLPLGARPTVRPPGMVLSRGAGSGWLGGGSAGGGWLLEGGLSAAGSFLAWLGRLTGRGELTAPEWPTWPTWPARAHREPGVWWPPHGWTGPAPRGGTTGPGPPSPGCTPTTGWPTWCGPPSNRWPGRWSGASRPWPCGSPSDRRCRRWRRAGPGRRRPCGSRC